MVTSFTADASFGDVSTELCFAIVFSFGIGGGIGGSVSWWRRWFLRVALSFSPEEFAGKTSGISLMSVEFDSAFFAAPKQGVAFTLSRPLEIYCLIRVQGT